MNITFTGLYTIKGPYNELKQIESTIDNKYREEYKFSGDGTKVYNYAGLYTLPKENTPVTELLVATNQDTNPLLNFLSKNYQQYNFVSYPKHEKPFKEVRSMIEAGFHDNPDGMLDAMLEKRKGTKYNASEESKRFIYSLAYSIPDKHVSDIKQLNAAEVIEAIKNNYFDFVNGVIKAIKK